MLSRSLCGGMENRVCIVKVEVGRQLTCFRRLPADYMVEGSHPAFLARRPRDPAGTRYSSLLSYSANPGVERRPCLRHPPTPSFSIRRRLTLSFAAGTVTGCRSGRLSMGRPSRSGITTSLTRRLRRPRLQSRLRCSRASMRRLQCDCSGGSRNKPIDGGR